MARKTRAATRGADSPTAARAAIRRTRTLAGQHVRLTLAVGVAHPGRAVQGVHAQPQATIEHGEWTHEVERQYAGQALSDRPAPAQQGVSDVGGKEGLVADLLRHVHGFM